MFMCSWLMVNMYHAQEKTIGSLNMFPSTLLMTSEAQWIHVRYLQPMWGTLNPSEVPSTHVRYPQPMWGTLNPCEVLSTHVRYLQPMWLQPMLVKWLVLERHGTHYSFTCSLYIYIHIDITLLCSELVIRIINWITISYAAVTLW